ncbi:malto-oligosyltrehalose synthase [Brachybacterium saurashtrense]|uniref:Malto-oligosyltrehalose synthase n=1 Tax=Brachybacterium saurashtrense TaxID=556288 RepID=A0A345YLV5_9MICO|nr:malto-oligosyltrehalose synthase [Brachybacterium saurashtrense]AXK44907.1 malto-oligosyltrehalose synthase [Brachybacterium saurashtrense]RRR21591.1 malto-oligosyltrehalose synthase [Brachybacterium saurashtrense]
MSPDPGPRPSPDTPDPGRAEERSRASATGALRAVRPVPTSTYRLQLHAGFTALDAAEIVPYLSRLGVGHLFCSPVLQAAPGSTHGYDVVDHSRIGEEIGGEDALRRLANAAHAHGMGLIVDVVPNHMAIPTPIWHNRALWSVLRDGPASPFADWFDVDLDGERSLLVPVLGRPIGTVLADGEISLGSEEVPQADGTVRTEPVVRYFDHVLPVAAGTEHLGLADLLDRQWYRLAYWKVADDELDYRRFFDVDTLAAVRVELPEVFEATHATLLRLQGEGVIDGYRIDHPDGLADPRGYLRDLEDATGGAWTVVEKILHGEEQLPGDLPCAGTTGYDALWRVGGLFHDPHGALGLTHLWQSRTGDLRPFEEVAAESTDRIISHSLWAEIERLTALIHRICQEDIRLRDTTRRNIQSVVVALLGSMDRYRAYIVPGEPASGAERGVIEQAAARARDRLGEDEDVVATLETVVALVCGDEVGSAGRTRSAERDEVVVRFAQTCGPVHAKGLEDTAFYRYTRFLPVNEVGADPERIGVAPDELHDHALSMVRTRPDAMTTLSTHDTKRSEDVRARLAVLTEQPAEWTMVVQALAHATAAHRGDRVDGAIELLLWQTLAACGELPGGGAAPLSPQRLEDYLLKAMREAKTRTAWTAQDPEYEQQVLALGRAALESEEVAEILADWTRRTAAAQRSAILGQKLVQLTMPGVPDVYQGNESVDLSLVDPDNRRAVDHAAHAARLARMIDGAGPDGIGDEKLWLTHRALGLRRERPELFQGREAAYHPLATTTGHALAFGRAHGEGPIEAVTVVTRLAHGLAQRGGWGESWIALPPGRWRDALSGAEREGGQVPLAALLEDWPVALLVRVGAEEDAR